MQPTFWLITVALLIQIAALTIPIFKHTQKQGADENTDHKFELRSNAWPFKSALAAIVIIVIATAIMPIIMRSGMDWFMVAAKNKQNHKFAACLAQIKREIPYAPVETALQKAIDERQTELVAWLLTQKPDVNLLLHPNDYRPLWWAMRARGNLQITELLLKAGADPNLAMSGQEKNNALHLALSMNYNRTDTLKYVALLASYGLDLNAPIDGTGKSAISGALTSSFKPASELLYELKRLGARPADNHKENLFFYGLSKGEPEVMKFLYDWNISSRETDSRGNNFLHLMLNAKCLSDRDAQELNYSPHIHEVINMQNNEGQTVLHLAVRQNNPKLVETLIKWKADPNIADKDGETPISHAEKNRYVRVLKLMTNNDSVTGGK